MNVESYTPIENYGGVFAKRDDLYSVCGVSGGKARSAYQIIKGLITNGYDEIVTTGSRYSPQCEIVSAICKEFGVKCTLFIPYGRDTSVMTNCREHGANIVQDDRWKYQNVLIHHSKKYSDENKCGYVPFGMECLENIETTKHQVQNIPTQIKRIIIPVGSGMSFCSVARGLDYYKRDIEILGVAVGKDPHKTIIKYYPTFNFSKHKIIKSDFNYSDLCDDKLEDLELDPIYEAKCVRYLKQGDLLWVVGKRL